MKQKSSRVLRADVTEAKRARDEWIQFFGDRPTRGLVLAEQRLVRAQVAECRAASIIGARDFNGAR